MESLKNSFVGLASIFGIEYLDWQAIPELFKFFGQTSIGILTIYYLILQINKIKRNENKTNNS